MSQIADDLRAAKTLIDTPEKWAQDAGEQGRCYCASTALSVGVGLGPHNPRYTEAMSALRLAGGFGSEEEVIAFNDRGSTTHADILALFDRAIASAETSS